MFTKTMPAFDATDLDYIETLPTGTDTASTVLEAGNLQADYEYEESTKQALAAELQRILLQDQECIRFGVDYVLYSLNKSSASTVCQIESQLEILREDILTIDLAIPNEPLTEAVLHTIDNLLSVIDANKEG